MRGSTNIFKTKLRASYYPFGTSGRRSSLSTGNDIRGPYKRHSFILSSLLSTFLIEGVLGSKNLLS